jgi:hypothetical protein
MPASHPSTRLTSAVLVAAAAFSLLQSLVNPVLPTIQLRAPATAEAR